MVVHLVILVARPHAGLFQAQLCAQLGQLRVFIHRLFMPSFMDVVWVDVDDVRTHKNNTTTVF